MLVIHHAPFMRFGLVRVIEADGRFEVCGEAADARVARQLFIHHQPSLVVLGLTLSGGDSFDLIRDFRTLGPTTQTIVISSRDDALSIQRALRAGARGYIVTHDDVAEIFTAFDEILNGNCYASAAVSRRLMESLTNGTIESAPTELQVLSERELQIFALIGRGFGPSQLANELHVSIKTVETYQCRIKEKLHLCSAAELSEKATRWARHSARPKLRFKPAATPELVFPSPNLKLLPLVPREKSR